LSNLGVSRISNLMKKDFTQQSSKGGGKQELWHGFGVRFYQHVSWSEKNRWIFHLDLAFIPINYLSRNFKILTSDIVHSVRILFKQKKKYRKYRKSHHISELRFLSAATFLNFFIRTSGPWLISIPLWTYNEFITCFHEFWIYKTWFFSYEIFGWSVPNGFSFKNQNIFQNAKRTVIFIQTFSWKNPITNRKFKIRENMWWARTWWISTPRTKCKSLSNFGVRRKYCEGESELTAVSIRRSKTLRSLHSSMPCK
jgi:hypothetical protein